MVTVSIGCQYSVNYMLSGIIFYYFIKLYVIGYNFTCQNTIVSYLILCNYTIVTLYYLDNGQLFD